MGKGDRKTRRGKIFNKSYGVKRPRKNNKSFTKWVEQKLKIKNTPSVSAKKSPLPSTKNVSNTMGMTKEEGIEQVYGGGGHVVILGAGASIASSLRNPEKNGKNYRQ